MLAKNQDIRTPVIFPWLMGYGLFETGILGYPWGFWDIIIVGMNGWTYGSENWRVWSSRSKVKVTKVKCKDSNFSLLSENEVRGQGHKVEQGCGSRSQVWNSHFQWWAEGMQMGRFHFLATFNSPVPWFCSFPPQWYEFQFWVTPFSWRPILNTWFSISILRLFITIFGGPITLSVNTCTLLHSLLLGLNCLFLSLY